MKIFRLKARIQGTKRSIRLDEDEILNTYIQTWVPNPDQDLYSMNDYIRNIIIDAPLRTGDWVKRLSIESTVVQDDIDLESSENIRIYGSDDNENVKWTFEDNLVHQIIRNIIDEEALFSTDLYELASQICSTKDVFGWGNVDPGDLTEEIASELVVMGYGDSDRF